MEALDDDDQDDEALDDDDQDDEALDDDDQDDEALDDALAFFICTALNAMPRLAHLYFLRSHGLLLNMFFLKRPPNIFRLLLFGLSWAGEVHG